MPNSVQRQMTAEERAFLMREIQFYKRNHIGELLFEVVMVATSVTLYLGGFAIVISIVFSWFIGALSSQLQNAEATAIFLGAAGVWIAAAVFLVWSTLANRKRVKATVVALETDAAAGSITEEKVTVAGIKCFKEPEHHGRIYFLLLGDGRVLEQPLTIVPKDWPEDETYCTIPWDDLDAVLSSTG